MRSLYQVLWSNDYTLYEKYQLSKAWPTRVVHLTSPQIFSTNILHIAVKSQDITLIKKVIATEKNYPDFNIDIKDSTRCSVIDIIIILKNKNLLDTLFEEGARALKSKIVSEKKLDWYLDDEKNLDQQSMIDLINQHENEEKIEPEVKALGWCSGEPY